MSATMSVRLPEELSAQLDALAEATGRTKTYLALQALQDYIRREAWQIAEIQQAITEADAGDFATEEEITALDQKWGFRAR